MVLPSGPSRRGSARRTLARRPAVQLTAGSGAPRRTVVECDSPLGFVSQGERIGREDQVHHQHLEVGPRTNRVEIPLRPRFRLMPEFQCGGAGKGLHGPIGEAMTTSVGGGPCTPGAEAGLGQPSRPAEVPLLGQARGLPSIARTQVTDPRVRLPSRSVASRVASPGCSTATLRDHADLLNHAQRARIDFIDVLVRAGQWRSAAPMQP
jgi:hypothetical protein